MYNDPVFDIVLISFVYLYITCGLGIAAYTYLNKHLPDSKLGIKKCLYYGILSIPIIIFSIIFTFLGLMIFTVLFVLLVLVSPFIYMVERIYTYIFYKIIYK